MSAIPADKFLDFFRYYDPKNDNQRKAILLLAAALPAGVLADDADWVKLFRTPVEKPAANDNFPHVPQQALDIIADFEGFRSEVYNDGVGVPTIGYGSTFYADGRRVQWGDPPITRDAAKNLLSLVVNRFQARLSQTIPDWAKMNDNQRSALLSFAYNLGEHFYGTDGFGTISRALRERRWGDVPDALLLYRNPGTSVEAGLLRRRKAEGELWRGLGKYAR